MLNIAVIFGGKSCEHDISVITGVLTANTLKEKFKVLEIYSDREGNWFTGKDLNKLSVYSSFNPKKYKRVTLSVGSQELFWVKGKRLKSLGRIDCVINCCHGLNGEDGSLSGLLRLCNIPLASPNIFCSAFAMDKEFTKIVLKGLKIPVLDYEVCRREDFKEADFKTKLTYPVIVKPANLGSSIGIERVESEEKLKEALSRAFVYDDKVIIERMLTDFTEINCACYEGEEIVVSECEKPISSQGGILSFSDKYMGRGKREFPAKIDSAVSEKIKKFTKKIYNSLGFEGIIRMDYMISDGKVFLNEINTVPGSLAYYLFAETIAEFSQILEKIIQKAIKSFNSYNKNRFKFTSSVLFNAGNIKK